MSVSTGEAVDRGRATSVDVDAEAAAVVGYLFSILALLVVVAGGEENEFVRFHVFQSAAYNLVVGVGIAGVFLVGTVVVTVGTALVFLLTWPVTLLASVPDGGAGGAIASVLLFVVFGLFVLVFGLSFLLAVFPLVAAVPVFGYLVYVAYRASLGERYAMPWIGPFVERYV